MNRQEIDPARYREVLTLCDKYAVKSTCLEEELASLREHAEYMEKKLAANQLAYRLGQTVIAQYDKSFWGVLGIPFALAREYSAYKKEKKVTAPTTVLSSKQIKNIENSLWGGFADFSIGELKNIHHDTKNPKGNRAAAALVLAQWYLTKNDFNTAYENITFCAQLVDSEKYRNAFAVEAACLFGLGRHSEVIRKIDRVLHESTPDRVGLLLLRAKALHREMLLSGTCRIEASKVCLDALNALLQNSGLAPLALRDSDKEAHIGNIHAPTAEPRQACDAKVSILMPAYNAAGTIEMALRSLMEQTWTNLEIIVVDDASTDGTCELVECLRSEDSRIRLVRQKENRGHLSARNTGLEHTTGELITVHDSDDWSHPQKIAAQVDALRAAPDAVATLSQLLRVTPDLEAVAHWKKPLAVYEANPSSLLFKKSLIDVIGPWDEVRISGDMEFVRRIKACFGDSSIITLKDFSILSLSLTLDSSLTSTSATHIATLADIFGVRHHYREAYTNWHKHSMAEYGRIHIGSKMFYTPLSIRPERVVNKTYNIVIAGDLSLPGGSYICSINYALAAHSSGQRVALLHWPYNIVRPMHSAVYDLCSETDIDILTSADTVSTAFLLVGLVAVPVRIPNSLPNIQATRVAVLVNQTAERLEGNKIPVYDPARVRENLHKAFDSEGIWIPISNGIRRIMENDARYPEPWPKTWLPIINTKQWLAEPIRWRASIPRVPVIGRHGRDQSTKWPADAETLKFAYGVNAPVRVHFMGGASVPAKILGYKPANWTVYGFNAMPVWLFLQGLDFLIHFPHPEYIEAFGRVVMEGMLAGKVVILPQCFEETFGNAAVYCEAPDVIPTVMRYWENEQLYLEQAKRGRDFVVRHCDWACLAERLADFDVLGKRYA